jgi:hypothetical protein
MIGSTNFNYSAQKEIYENFMKLARTGSGLEGTFEGTFGDEKVTGRAYAMKIGE